LFGHKSYMPMPPAVIAPPAIRRWSAATISPTRTAGFAGGLDYRVTPNTAMGVALAGGGTNWSLANGLGGGKSDARLEAGGLFCKF
jgi:hypothetical protein